MKINAALFATLLITPVLFLACSSENESWNDDIMYFILIDRYVDGDPSNNDGGIPESYWPYDSNPEALKHYQGGDLRGVIENLDDIKAMGFTSIWLSPFLDNSDGDYVGWWPYHGYHPVDFKAVDEHFGTLEDVKELVAEAHERKLKVIFDMPFNQVAADHPWLSNPAKRDWFHWDSSGKPYEITNWYDQEQIERGELHGLPDLAQENPDVYDFILDVSRFWIQETGCDGFRLDAVKHIPVDFWKRYNADIKAIAGDDFLLMGEVFWGDFQRMEPYMGIGFDALFDIPGYYAIGNTFARNASMGEFSQYIQQALTAYNPEIRATIIDNHDVARFNTGLNKQGWPRTQVALTWLMTTPGLPVIYSGTELGMVGAPVKSAFDGSPQDYLNRLPYPDQLNIRQSAHKLETAGLMQMRHNKPALRQGSFHELYKDWSIYAYVRATEKQTMLVVLSNSATQELVNITIPAGLELTEDPLKMMGEGSARTMDDGLYLKLPPFAATIWELNAPIPADMPQWVNFTDRYSRDFLDVKLKYRETDVMVEKLQVAGSFTNWEPTDYPTQRKGDVITLNLKLKPGEYDYKLVINDTLWIADPGAVRFSMDPYGGQNSQMRVRAPLVKKVQGK